MSEQRQSDTLAPSTRRSFQKHHDNRDSHDEYHPVDRLASGVTIGQRDEENSFTHYRNIVSEYAGEFLGTMILCIFGIGANCQANLSKAPSLGTPAGNYTSLSLAWGAGIALGVWISNGGHINPAITVAVATWREFPWKKVPFYILAQVLGAIVGGAIVYGNYVHAISVVEGGSNIRTMKTAGLFGTFPLSFMSDVSAFFSEFLGSAMLVFGFLTFTDEKIDKRTGIKNGLPSYFVPIGFFIVLYGIGTALGYETGFALNPARDFGPRAVTAMVGYGSQVFTTRRHYWLWSPIIACILGAQVATFLYDLLIYKGKDSLVYRILGPRRRREGNPI